MTTENSAQSNTPAAKRLDVVIVGAGFGGMYAVYKFRQMGLNFQAFELGGDVGGVWYWNRYPGARCDLMSVDYSYGFSEEIQQEWTWSEQFAAQPEILAYANFVADRLDLRKHFKFNTRVESAIWNEEKRLWEVTTDKGERFEATYCVMATGPLSVPKDPEIPGIEKFKGRLLRAQKWPHEPISFEGKRVGLIGTGSTGIQIVQEVGRQAGELFVFQRTPSFTLPMRNNKLTPEYVAEVKRNYKGIREAARNSPNGGVRPVITRPFFSVMEHQRKQILEDTWNQGGLAFLGAFSDLMQNEEANEAVADFVRSKIEEVVNDKETAEALKPRGYPIFARRPCLDTEYYETYNLPTVHLVNCLKEQIVEITEKGVRTESREIELDILIFATGYDALTGALRAFNVVGRNGLKIQDYWKEGPQSFLGLMMEGFPNLFTTAGANGPSALANLITINEHDVDWIAGVIEHMKKNDLATVEPKKSAVKRWMDIVHALATRTLVSKAKTWWTGTNVQGKPHGLTMFTGGFNKYREHCTAAADNGYVDFSFEPREERKAA